MFLAPPHQNFQRWSGHGVFCTFPVRNVLRATTACTFSISQLPKVLRRWSVFVHFGFEICFGVQFLISHLPRWLRARRFSKPTLRSPKTLAKHCVSRLFYLFARLHLLSSDSFSSLIFFLLLFSSLLWLFSPLLFHLSNCRKFDFWTSFAYI